MDTSPAMVGDLVQLKALLDQAIRAAQSSAPLTRLTAVVLLDAVNERAMHVAASGSGIHLGENDKFDTCANKLEAGLGERWQRPAWSDVRRLHRSRNLAQHEGIPADRDSLPAWTAATHVFARSLVTAVFDRDLNDVVMADAIRDADAAGALREAEARLADNDAAAAFTSTMFAFEIGRNRWLAERPADAEHRQPSIFDVMDRKSWESTQAQLRQLQELVAIQEFATDPTEYIWLKGVEYAARRVPPSMDEAQRAFSFVFWWLIRWEAFSATFIANRHEHAQRRSGSRGPRTLRDRPVSSPWTCPSYGRVSSSSV